MTIRLLVMGAGAVGGYVGGHLSRLGHDVTLVDFWHDNVERIRSEGLEISGDSPADSIVVRPKTLHFHEVSGLARQTPFDVVFLSMKSYDTDWATTMIRPYLAPDGFIVSLQNCINEERIAGIVGWGRTIGCIASRISVELHAPGRVRRKTDKRDADNVVFRVGEVHGRVTARANMIAEMLGGIDKSKVRTNLWGERWSKLCRNAMGGGLAALSGLTGRQLNGIETARRIQIRLGAEGVRIGQALGFSLEKIGQIEPALLARAFDIDDAAAEVDRILSEDATSDRKGNGGSGHRPSLGQDIAKGRRTEIEYMNGYIAQKGRDIGLPAPTHELVTKLVKQIERGDMKAEAANIAAFFD